MIILIFLFMGVKADFIASVFGGEKPNLAVVWIIIVLCIAIFGYAFTQVYGEKIKNITAGSDTTDATGGDALAQNIGQILFTPKIMGMFFLLGLAALVIRFVTIQAT